MSHQGLTSVRLYIRIVLVALVAAIGLMLALPAHAQETRSIHLLHKHTGEEIYITYKRYGRYDGAALEKLNWFLRDWRTDQPTRMDPKLFDIVASVYEQVGASGPIHVVSAYRSAGTNAMLRRRSRAVAKSSQHILGKAMDFYIPGVSMPQVRAAGLQLQRGGVGFYPGSANLFVHMDTGSVRHWPKVSRDYLARLFPDGKTVHIPADGRPMPGYEQAVSIVLARGGTVAGFGGGEVGETDVASGPGIGGFFAALFGVRPEPAPVMTQRGRALRPAPQPAPVEVAEAEPFKPAAAPVVAKAEEPKPKFQMAFAPMPRPAPSAEERLAAAVQQMAFAPMPLPRPSAEQPQAAPTPQQVAAIADGDLPAAAPLPLPRNNGRPMVLDEAAKPGLPPLIATGEQRAVAAIPSGSLPPPQAALGFVAAPPIPAPAPAMALRTDPPKQTTYAVASAPPLPPRKPAAPAPLIAPTVEGSRGRTAMAPVATPAMKDAPMTLPNPQQLKLIEQPAQVVAQGFSRNLSGQPQAQRFSGPAVAAIRTVNFNAAGLY